MRKKIKRFIFALEMRDKPTRLNKIKIMQLVKINTDQINSFNFLHYKYVYLKTWNKEKTSHSHEVVKVNLEVFEIQINHSKQELKINGKKYDIKHKFNTVYELSKMSKIMFAGSSESLEKHFKESKEQGALFHHATYGLLKRMAK